MLARFAVSRTFGGHARLFLTHYPTANAARKARASTESVALRLARPSRLLRAPFALAPRGPAMSEARRAESNGGEGRVRTSVARRRQVYSLLRLTALPPPRNHLSEAFRSGCGRDALADVIHEPLFALSIPCIAESVCVRCFPEDVARWPMELAEGFEPPTT